MASKSKAPFHIIIPARYASSRLPGKPLVDICGKPMIQHVYERACESGAKSIIIATDDKRILKVAHKFGADVCMTSEHHPRGTDRIGEVVTTRKFPDNAIIINLQGDEPLVSPGIISQLASALSTDHQADMATMCEPIEDNESLINPSIVKVVFDKNSYALYFSRAMIPWDVKCFSDQHQNQNIIHTTHYRHIGIYAYRVGFIKQYISWPVSLLEQSESLEQLRALWHGAKILVSLTEKQLSIGVDTEADLQQVRKLLKNKS